VFSRRHPYLFFVLIFTAIMSVTMISISLLTIIGQGRSGVGFGDKVGVIEVKGVIADSKRVIRQIKDFRENDSIKAIVIRIDSPGGAVGPSQEIYTEIRKTTKIKKVIASFGAIAASGGYYIASATDGIISNPGTVTGSIGVIVGYTNFKALFDKIGLYPVVIKSGEFKDLASPVREMTESERALLQGFTDTVHNQFIKDVADARKMNIEDIRKIADGRIFSGEKAVALGMVDRLGNLEDAIEWAGKLGGIEGKISTVYPPEEKLPFMKYLLDMSAGEISDLVNQLSISQISGGYLYYPEHND